MKKIVAAMDVLNRGVLFLLSLWFGLVALLTLLQVIFRYIFNNPIVWSEEVIRYSMIWIVLLGTAIALRKGMLISVEIVIQSVPKTVKKIMGILVIGVNVVYLSLLSYYGIKIIITLGAQTSGSLEIPISMTYSAIAAGSILALLNCIVVFMELVQGKEEKNDGSTLL
ncbi:TRAP transporter small permease [Aeribacillus sp. FSL K6-8394]|uniref:TRAP transporter small permease n=1 Tax=Aeribacillus sp. FSL K6-8394 TaxID=2954570 RepID=UPI0030F8C6B3